jgi:peptide/nickel transport system permease protein
VLTDNRDKRRYLELWVDDWEYSYIDISWNLPGDWFDVDIKALTSTKHLFGMNEGGIHLFGTDKTGKDIFSRTLHAIYTSLLVGTLGVIIAFVLALVIGGISGYFGGWIDSVLQMFTDAIRTVPPIPLFMAFAAFMPDTWSSEVRFFFIASVLGLIGWPTLARRIRTHLLTERSQEYVLAAELCGAKPGHVIRRHLLPSFTSYIIVDVMITFPYVVRSETALSFIGLGLTDPVNSLGSLMQNVSKADVLLNYQWYLIPVIFFIAFVLAFVFVGDGLRDAADPYSQTKK